MVRKPRVFSRWLVSFINSTHKDSVADDFVIHNGKPYSVHWDPKGPNDIPDQRRHEISKVPALLNFLVHYVLCTLKRYSVAS